MSKLMCMMCGKVLESKSRHDFQQCNCPNKAYIDGGYDYIHAGARDLNLIKILNDEGVFNEIY